MRQKSGIFGTKKKKKKKKKKNRKKIDENFKIFRNSLYIYFFKTTLFSLIFLFKFNILTTTNRSLSLFFSFVCLLVLEFF